MPSVRKNTFRAALLLMIALALWFGFRGSSSRDNVLSSQTLAGLTSARGPANSGAPVGFRTKAGIREPAAPRATHSPHKLKEFILPTVAIDGLELEAALRKLMEVYQEACDRSGEMPLALKFIVPAGASKKLYLSLSGRNFASSVQLLASLSGTKVSRNGLTYQFTPFIDERKPVSRDIRVSPGLTSTLSEMAGQATDANPTPQINELLRKLGLDLDPTTRVSLTASGLLHLETSSTADAEMVTALLQGIRGQMPQQHKFTSMVIDLAADAEWTPPDVSQITDSQLQLLMREAAKSKGSSLLTLPSITARGGQGGTVEMTRDPRARDRRRPSGRGTCPTALRGRDHRHSNCA